MTSYVVDANLIVLLVVGSYDVDLIANRRHKRCSVFDTRDFVMLDDLLHKAESVRCTPHAMAEASNLVRLIGEPLRSDLTMQLGKSIPSFCEDYAASTDASSDVAFPRLDLTDASILAVAEDYEILTTDLDLYLAALGRGLRATNFTHLRDRR